MKNDKVAIVGGASFVGSRLATFLDYKSLLFEKDDIDLTIKSHQSIYLDIEDHGSLDKLADVTTIRVCIEARPAVVDRLSRAGDWEGDTIIGL
jgi:IS30 family transposase